VVRAKLQSFCSLRVSIVVGLDWLIPEGYAS